MVKPEREGEEKKTSLSSRQRMHRALTRKSKFRGPTDGAAATRLAKALGWIRVARSEDWLDEGYRHMQLGPVTYAACMPEISV